MTQVNLALGDDLGSRSAEEIRIVDYHDLSHLASPTKRSKLKRVHVKDTVDVCDPMSPCKFPANLVFLTKNWHIVWGEIDHVLNRNSKFPNIVVLDNLPSADAYHIQFFIDSQNRPHAVNVMVPGRQLRDHTSIQ